MLGMHCTYNFAMRALIRLMSAFHAKLFDIRGQGPKETASSHCSWCLSPTQHLSFLARL